MHQSIITIKYSDLGMKNILQISIKLKVIFSFILLFTFTFFIIEFLHQEGVIKSSEEKYFHQKLQEFITSGQEHIKLRELTNFDWIIACPRNPYDFIKIDDEYFGRLDDESTYIDFYYNATGKRIFFDHNSTKESLFTFRKSSDSIMRCFNPRVQIRLDEHNKLNFF